MFSDYEESQAVHAEQAFAKHLVKEQKWKRNDHFSNIYQLSPESDFRAYKDFSPIQLFELFFDDETWELLTSENRRYALQKGLTDPEISSSEMRCFIGILIMSGYCPRPGKRYFWDQGEDMRNHAIYKAMRRNRFERIMQCLHLNDNTSLNSQDKFSKVRPMVALLQHRFMKHFQPSQHLSHDESIIEYFGKHSCKQCIRNKPIRFGYKVWCLSSTHGYLINFDLYQGKTLEGNTELEKVVGKCSATVLQLIEKLPIDKKEFPLRFVL